MSASHGSGSGADVVAHEKALIGSILYGGIEVFDGCVAAGIVESSFFDVTCGMTFDACEKLAKAGRPVDLLTVAKFLEGKTDLQALEAMTDAAVTCAYWPEYARLVKDRALRRYLRLEIDQCRAELNDYDIDAEDLRSRLEKAIADLSTMEGASHSDPTSREIIDEQIDFWQQAVDRGFAGLDTGLSWWNVTFGGMLPGGVYFVSGPPGCYKTTLVRQIAQYVAGSTEKRVDMATLEQSSGQVLGAVVANQCNTSIARLNNAPRQQDVDNVRNFKDRVASWPLYVSDRAFTPTTLWSWARRAVAQGSQLLVLDYLQALSPDGRVDSEERRVSEASRTVTRIAKDLKTRFLVVSSESNEGRLRYSGQIEYDAWGWIRMELTGGETVQVEIRKNRFGARPPPFEMRPEHGVLRWEGPIAKPKEDGGK